MLSDIAKYYDAELPQRTSPEAGLLAEYLRKNGSKKNNYNSRLARIIYSGLLSTEDKRRIIFSDSPELIAAVGELPLKCEKAEPPRPIAELSGGFAPERQEEMSDIDACLIWQGGASGAKPLLLVCEDGNLYDEYVDAIMRAYGDAAVDRINVAVLSGQDVAPTRDNFVINSLINRNTARGVFLLENVEGIRAEYVPDIIKLIDTPFRRKYSLREPRLSLDLSNCVFVLLARTKDVDPRLYSGCFVIRANDAYPIEKEACVDKRICSAKSVYGCEELEFDESAKQILSSYSFEQCSAVIDAVCRKSRRLDVDNKVITERDVRKITIPNSAPLRLGFGLRGEK